MSKDHPYKLLKALRERGWFEEVKSPHKSRNGRFSSGHYRLLSHAEWAAKFPAEAHPATQQWDEEHEAGDQLPVQKKPSADEVTSPTMGDDQSDYGVYQSDYGVYQRPNQDITSIKPLSKPLKTLLPSHIYKEPVRLRAAEVFEDRDRDAQADTRSAPAPVQKKPSAPVPKKVSATVEAVRLATTITKEFQNHGESYEQGWREAVQHLLNQGHDSADILKMVELMKEYFSTATTEEEGGAGFISFLKQKRYDTPQGFPMFLTWLEQESRKKEGGMTQ
jgi:hypothetical protein